jgi:two-component system, OmpR family, response regulator
MRLLLLEDDDVLGDAVCAFLRAEGHRVDWFRSLHDTVGQDHEPFDALLVDWQLPDGSGLQWLKARRTRGDRTPAMMLTARDRLNHRVEGLDSGADDYLVKPFALEELAARLRVIGRRLAGDPVSRFGDVAVDLQARTASCSGVRIDLTAREWSLLEALVLRPGRIVSKSDLERLVIGSSADIASNALEVYVSALRRKLGRDLIETVRGIGYRLRASP